VIACVCAVHALTIVCIGVLLCTLQTLKELATVVQRVASGVASSKDAATAQADLEFAKSLAVDMGGAPSSLEKVFEVVQAAIFKVQISSTLNNRK
jgi:hypothetical protein